MSETSGFFEAELDETTGNYDLEYLASQFAAYFALFIGNGVFASPTDQLKVVAGTGLNVVVKKGYAFINGYWYYNDSDKILPVTPNTTALDRIDCVRARLNVAERTIESIAFFGETGAIRNGSFYDLVLSEFTTKVASSQILDADIVDKRSDENVCGFVTGLLNVIGTNDLFQQFTAQFTTWFNQMKGQLTTDAAGNLQTQIDDLSDVVGNSIFIGTPGDITQTIPSNADMLGNQPPEYYAKQSDVNTLNTNLNADVGDLSTVTDATYTSISDLFQFYIDNGYLPKVGDIPLIPIMTSNTTPSGVVSGGPGTMVGAFYMAFDGNDGTRWQSSALDGYLVYQFPTAKVVRRIAIKGHLDAGANPLNIRLKNVTVQGSSDGTNFTYIDSFQVANNNSMQSFAISNTTAYKYYKLVMPDSWINGYVSVVDCQMYGNA